jgi:hypothetical protein
VTKGDLTRFEHRTSTSCGVPVRQSQSVLPSAICTLAQQEDCRGRGRKINGITNIDWRQADPAPTAPNEFDWLTSTFGVMFFGDRVAAATDMGRAAASHARMAFVCWCTLPQNP